MKRMGLFFVLLVIASSVFQGCSSRPPMMGGVPGEEDPSFVGLYRLRSLDPLQVSLLGIPEEKIIETVIDEKGCITLPYIDEPVKASGLTTSELEREIEEIYTGGKIYRNITVNVLTSSKTYYMEGEVRNPQAYSLTRRMTLLEAIAAASGYTEYANPKNVTISRNGQVIKVNAKDIEKHPDWDIIIEAGDRINVHRSFF